MTRKLILDWRLIIPILIIFSLSLSILFSISPRLAWAQLGYFLLGLLLFSIFSNFNYLHHQPLINHYSFLSLLLLVFPFIFGAVTRGSVRWIQLGSLTLQPSEIIKPFLILIFAHTLSKTPRYFIYFLSLIIPTILIFKQPDLGSTLVVVVIWLGIWLASDLPKYLLLIFSLILAGLSPLIYLLLKPYQKLRISSFLNPFADPKGSGYQVIQSTIAVGSGKLLGRGLGLGTQSQLNFLPERHSDFIFASLAEELGLFGSMILILAIFFLLKRLLVIASKAPDKFSQLISIGVFSMIFFQSAVNIGMNLGLLPITGITLPLVSAGGSSMLSIMIALGLVSNISSTTINKKGLEIK